MFAAAAAGRTVRWCWSLVLLARGGRRFLSPGCTRRTEPRDDVGDFLWSKSAAGDVGAPIGGAGVGVAGDDEAAQTLIADEFQIGRINDGMRCGLSRLRRAIGGRPDSYAVGAMAAGTGCGIGFLSI